MKPNEQLPFQSTDDKIAASRRTAVYGSKSTPWYAAGSIKRYMKVHVKIAAPLAVVVMLALAGSTSALVLRQVRSNEARTSATTASSDTAFDPLSLLGIGNKASTKDDQTNNRSDPPKSDTGSTVPTATGSSTKPRTDNPATTTPKPTATAPKPGTSSPIPNPSTTPIPTPVPTPPNPVLVNTSFDTFTTSSPMVLSQYKTAMGDPTMSAGNSNLVNTSIVAVTGRGKVMRQVLPANAYGGSSGIVTFPKLSRAVDDASIQYDIRFNTGFIWSLGGKLPGLSGAVAPTSPGVAAGCATGSTQAWSGRGMWSASKWIGYMYNFNKRNDCGDNVGTNRGFVAGQWHTIKQRYKMNTPGKADGIHQMWFDGTLVVDNHAFNYRNNSNLHINYIMWSMFRGGSTADWASPTSDSIDIDNLLVTTPV